MIGRHEQVRNEPDGHGAPGQGMEGLIHSLCVAFETGLAGVQCVSTSRLRVAMWFLGSACIV